MAFPNTHFHRHRGQSFPTPALIYLIHDAILRVSPGRAGVAHEAVIESAAAKPVESAFGEDAYPTFFTKVAALGSTLAHDHGFSDGNKRTALEVMSLTLKRNGFFPTPTEREAATVMILVAMGLLDIQGLRVALMMWCGVDPADQNA